MFYIIINIENTNIMLAGRHRNKERLARKGWPISRTNWSDMFYYSCRGMVLRLWWSNSERQTTDVTEKSKRWVEESDGGHPLLSQGLISIAWQHMFSETLMCPVMGRDSKRAHNISIGLQKPINNTVINNTCTYSSLNMQSSLLLYKQTYTHTHAQA